MDISFKYISEKIADIYFATNDIVKKSFKISMFN